MSQVFDQIFNKIIKQEGGYVNDPVDKGGETYRGISRKAWPKWEGWKEIDAKKKTGAVKKFAVFPDLEDEVKSFYYNNYFVKELIHKVKDPGLAFQLFDIRMGHTGGSGWLVRNALNQLGLAKYDISSTPKMKMAWNEDLINTVNTAKDPKRLFEKLKEGREAYVAWLVRVNPSQSKFIKGWLNDIRSGIYEMWNGLADTPQKKNSTSGFSS